MSSTAVVETEMSEFERGVKVGEERVRREGRQAAEEAAWNWRFFLTEQPIGTEEEFEQLVRRVEKLLAAEVIDRDWADVIVGRRYADVHKLVVLVDTAVAVDWRLGGSLVCGITGGDYEMCDAEALVELIETAVAAGFWG